MTTVLQAVWIRHTQTHIPCLPRPMRVRDHARTVEEVGGKKTHVVYVSLFVCAHLCTECVGEALPGTLMYYSEIRFKNARKETWQRR